MVCVLYLSLVGTIAAFWLYYWLLKRVESTKAMMISLVTPLLAVLIGAVTIGERLPPQTLVGGIDDHREYRTNRFSTPSKSAADRGKAGAIDLVLHRFIINVF